MGEVFEWTPTVQLSLHKSLKISESLINNRTEVLNQSLPWKLRRVFRGGANNIMFHLSILATHQIVLK